MHKTVDRSQEFLLPRSRTSRAPGFRHLAADLVVCLVTAAFCWLAVRGLSVFSPLGIGMSSDLQNYAQILEAAQNPELFAHDPVGELLPFDPGVPNMLTALAPFFPGANMAESLIMAGGVAIFCQIFGWYVFGRVVFGSPALSALLATVGSITYYWAFGTYWGACHEQALPRIFFNALWPFFLLAGTWAMRSLKARLALSLALGLSIFVHSVSALMLGGMFLMAFLICPVRPRENPAQDAAPISLSGSVASRRKSGARTAGASLSRSLSGHLASILACTVLFAVPVIAFLLQHTPVENPEPAIFETLRQIFELRFHKDWGDIRDAITANVLPLVVNVPLLPVGALALVYLLHRRKDLEGPARDLALLLPLLLVGMASVVLVCQAEMALAPRFSRMHMSHEILRGTRFLIPMSLLSITIVISLFIDRLPRLLCGFVATATAVAIFLLSPDLVVLAARTELRDTLGMELEAPAREIVAKSRLELEALRAIEKNVPGDETVFSPVDAMSVRYVLRHPLEPVHKDGNIIYYSRRIDLGRPWLDIQQMLAENPRAALDAWQKSPARWMLSPRGALPENFGEREDTDSANATPGNAEPLSAGFGANASLEESSPHDRLSGELPQNAQSSGGRLPGKQLSGTPSHDIVFANRDWVLLKKRG